MGRKPGQPRRPYDKCLDPGHFNAKPELAAVYWELYQQGFSTTDIAKAHGVSRGAIHTLLKSHGYRLREKKQLPFIMFNGGKYTLKPSGYYARTDKGRSLLHRNVWEYHNGQIPDGWDVHHINEDKQDNRLENLECIPKGEHTRHHSRGKEGGFKKGLVPHNARAVRRLDTGEVYPSARKAARAVGRTSSAITNSIKNGTKSAGIKWEWV